MRSAALAPGAAVIAIVAASPSAACIQLMLRIGGFLVGRCCGRLAVALPGPLRGPYSARAGGTRRILGQLALPGERAAHDEIEVVMSGLPAEDRFQAFAAR